MSEAKSAALSIAMIREPSWNGGGWRLEIGDTPSTYLLPLSGNLGALLTLLSDKVSASPTRCHTAQEKVSIRQGLIIQNPEEQDLFSLYIELRRKDNSPALRPAGNFPLILKPMLV
ncbi:hypothetical protein RRG08_015532 [Elysia crispata]|uniref:Uncharacterized protein n=1 Tax=Elysia crispata TaxID=231223 RepID=A0AAE0YIQ2_9GAST|nr:hypothetical protein RRG08_015532 [Elysia crispata]